MTGKTFLLLSCSPYKSPYSLVNVGKTYLASGLLYKPKHCTRSLTESCFSHLFFSLSFLKRCEICSGGGRSRPRQQMYELEMLLNNLGGDTGD